MELSTKATILLCEVEAGVGVGGGRSRGGDKAADADDIWCRTVGKGGTRSTANGMNDAAARQRGVWKGEPSPVPRPGGGQEEGESNSNAVEDGGTKEVVLEGTESARADAGARDTTSRIGLRRMGCGWQGD